MTTEVESMSWDLIFWEQSVDYVPSSWGNASRTKYVWPTHIRSQSKVDEMICDCLPPTVQGKWIEYPAKFKKRVKSLEEAKELCSKLQYQSTLSEGEDSSEEDTEYSLDDSIKKLAQEREPTPDLPAPSSEGIFLQEHVMQKILETLEELKLQQKLIAREINETKLLLDKLVAGQENLAPLAQSKFPLPIKQEEELECLETEMENPENYNHLVLELSLTGGENLNKYIRNILKKLLAKDICQTYSGHGKKGKKDFSKLKIRKAVVDAIRRRFPQATDVDIDKIISTVLATSSDWEGGRKKRPN